MRIKAPCWSDPESWDLDPGRGPHPPVEQLQHACLTQCPMYVKCREDADDDPEWFGVRAGIHRPWPGDSVVLMLNQKTQFGRVTSGLNAQIQGMAPGDRMPSAAEIAREYGVARTTANSALRWLANENLLVRPAKNCRNYEVPQRTENAA